jgi:hypothetical protein
MNNDLENSAQDAAALPPAPRRENMAERMERYAVEKIEAICAMRGDYDDGQLIGYVYREDLQGGRYACAPANRALDDHEFGIMYGPGVYTVLYHHKPDDGSRLKHVRSLRYHIDSSYADLHEKFCIENGLTPRAGRLTRGTNTQSLGGFNVAAALDPKNMQGYAQFLGVLKTILAPPGEDARTLQMLMAQNTELIKSLAAPRTGGTSDAIVTEALRMLKTGGGKGTDFQDMLQNLGQMKEVISGFLPAPAAGVVQDAEEQETPMQKMINKALDHLPDLLAAYNGNVAAAAAAAANDKKNKLTGLLIKNSPALQAQFHSAMVDRFGREHADQWATAYGITPPNILPFPEAPPAPPQQQLKQVVF